jgi:hypothetical protein
LKDFILVEADRGEVVIYTPAWFKTCIGFSEEIFMSDPAFMDTIFRPLMKAGY